MLSIIAVCAAAGGKYAGSITAGVNGTNTGFSSGSHGSRSPTTLVDGKTFAILNDDSFSNSCALRVSGFGADPGTAYLQYVVANGLKKDRSAASYSYSGGNATWTWAAQTFGFVNTVTYPVVIA